MRFFAVFFGLALSAAAGCSQQIVSPPVSHTTLAMPLERPAPTFKTVYSFKGSPDGSKPLGGVVVSNIAFLNFEVYGTTSEGGAPPDAAGVVWRVDLRSGREVVLHTFHGSSTDGAAPYAGLATLNPSRKIFYGTTLSGGASNTGTIYEVHENAGPVNVIHSFNDSDGAHPVAELTAHNDTLYGTARFGGAAGKGVVFKLNPDGTERVIHSFTNTPDGNRPLAALTLWNGAFYGTTELGGAHNIGCVFEVQLDGTERVLYSFKGGTDGYFPLGGVTVFIGALYGDTLRGGAHKNGTIFRVNKDGTERVIHSFKGSDGRQPRASLIVFNKALYGTTFAGGASDDGTIFESRAGAFLPLRVLHEFSGADGKNPNASLTVYPGGRFLGTTELGGESGHGTVFELTP